VISFPVLYCHAKHLAVKPNLSLEDVESHYRQAKDPVALIHWQIVWLLAQDKTMKQIVELPGILCDADCEIVCHRHQ